MAEIDGRRVEAELPGRLGRHLFVFLVLNRLREVSRDELVAALWPDGVDAGLAPLLSKLRRLAPVTGRSELRLALPDPAWVDLEAAGDALHRAESAVARGDAHAAYGPARVTQHIAMRGFSVGLELPWAVEARARLERMHARALELLAGACLDIGGAELATGVRAAQRLVSIEPFSEAGHRLLIQLLAARGERAEALRAFDALRILLREELGVTPSAETQRLHQALLR